MKRNWVKGSFHMRAFSHCSQICLLRTQSRYVPLEFLNRSAYEGETVSATDAHCQFGYEDRTTLVCFGLFCNFTKSFYHFISFQGRMLSGYVWMNPLQTCFNRRLKNYKQQPCRWKPFSLPISLVLYLLLNSRILNGLVHSVLIMK